MTNQQRGHDSNIEFNRKLDINLKRTQFSFVPLEDRFKSFPPDSDNAPVTDFRLFYDAFANGRLERGTLDLLYPTPPWLRRKFKKLKVNQPYLIDGEGKFFLVDTPTQEVNLIASEKP